MRTIFNYVVCSASLFLVILLLVGGSLAWMLVGLVLAFCLYMWGQAFPRYWRKFWVTNMKILRSFGCI